MGNPTDFFEAVYWDNEYRIHRKRNLVKDIELYHKNESYLSEERKLIVENFSEEYNVFFIVGVPRSGSTLLTQLICSTNMVCYFNNFISKYWMAPIYGAKVFKSISNDKEKIKYNSELGLTSGDHSPHEFGFFWQHWMNHRNSDYLNEKDLNNINWTGLNDELKGYAGYHKKNLLVKNLNYNSLKITSIKKHIPNSKFIFIRRDPRFVVQSILTARELQYGNQNAWWSTRIPNYKLLYSKPAIDQVISQLTFIINEVESQLKNIKREDIFELNYLDLDKKEIVEKLLAFVINGPIPSSIAIPSPKNVIKRNDFKEIESKLKFEDFG